VYNTILRRFELVRIIRGNVQTQFLDYGFRSQPFSTVLTSELYYLESYINIRIVVLSTAAYLPCGVHTHRMQIVRWVLIPIMWFYL
jgi:hypothetical protein